MLDQDYAYLGAKLLKLTNVDLAAYKTQQMRRRLDTYIGNRKAASVAAYCKTIEQDRGELDSLLDFLTINVSEFLRDADRFEYLAGVVIPELLKRTYKLNIWSAACSRGQEPYTLAMLMQERFPKSPYRILATDLDRAVLERAKAGGPYPAAELKNLEGRMVCRFFKKDGSQYSVADCLKSGIEFRRHNLLCDPYERGFDLILCRNVIIYLSDDARSKVVREFNKSLNLWGMLFTGGSEVILEKDAGFTGVRPSFYKKMPVAEMAGATR